MHDKLAMLVLVGCGSATAGLPDIARVAIGAAPAAPEILLPGIVSTGDDDCHATLSPDGKTLFFLKSTPSFDFYTIVYTERRGGAWTRPRTAPFSGQYADGDLVFTPDGRRAYFVSMRPVGSAASPGKAGRVDPTALPFGSAASPGKAGRVDGKPRTDTEIWTVERDARGGWGEPRHVDELSSPTDEWFPTLTADGTTTTRPRRAIRRGRHG